VQLRQRGGRKSDQNNQNLKLFFSLIFQISKSQKQALSSHSFFINHSIKIPEARNITETRRIVRNTKGLSQRWLKGV
jgi:hypothetical protein